MINSNDYKNIETLIDLKIINDSDMFFNEGFLLNRVNSEFYENKIAIIAKNMNWEKAGLGFSHVVKEEDFYEIALGFLEYEKGIDYLQEDTVEFIRQLNLFTTGYEKYTNLNFLNHIIELLKAKTKAGLDFFEKLCINGVFEDYNLGKEIPEILVFNGKTQPIFDYDKSIYEKVYIETPLDTDKDGKRDLISAYIRRPAESDKGMKVPTIYIASPYMMGCNEDLYDLHNMDYDLEVFEETDIDFKEIKYKEEEIEIPEKREVKGKTKGSEAEEIGFDTMSPWYKYFVTRGYAVVLAGGIGTFGSEGIRNCGSVEETISTTAVIDWLNGRITGFSNKEDNLEVVADWSTGNVGMTGKSYLGTLAIAAAATGVEGLKTIVPEAAISNWYEYYRCNGLNVSPLHYQGDDADLLSEYCFSRRFNPYDYNEIKELFDQHLEKMIEEQDRVTGNYNKFWDERNYLNNVDKMKASVFIVHGLRDWNVMPKQFDMLWRKLEENNIPKKMILHQGAHIHIDNLATIDYSDIMNKWYAHWLYNVENKIMEDLPNVMIQNNTNTDKWDISENWPFDNMKDQKFFIDRFNKLSKTKEEGLKRASFVDDLSLTGFNREELNVNIWLDSLVDNPQIKKPYRLAYLGDQLEKDTRISGEVEIEFKGNLDRGTGVISAMLVDYGTENRPLLDPEIVEEEGIIYGINAGREKMVDFKKEERATNYDVITRGWMSAQNRRNNYNKDEVIVGQDYTFKFKMIPIDYTVLKGHRLGLIIYSTDAESTPRQLIKTKFNIDQESLTVNIPMN